MPYKIVTIFRQNDKDNDGQLDSSQFGQAIWEVVKERNGIETVKKEGEKSNLKRKLSMKKKQMKNKTNE